MKRRSKRAARPIPADYGMGAMRARLDSIYVQHPPAPWTSAYRARVRRALRMRAWTLGYADPDQRADDLTRREEAGGHALTKQDFKSFGGAE